MSGGMCSNLPEVMSLGGFYIQIDSKVKIKQNYLHISTNFTSVGWCLWMWHLDVFDQLVSNKYYVLVIVLLTSDLLFDSKIEKGIDMVKYKTRYKQDSV